MLKLKGAAGLYVGWESHTVEPKVVSKAWFRELAPPYRNGFGYRIRFGSRAIQFGHYRKSREKDPTPLSQLGGRELPFKPGDIGSWNGPSQVDSET